MTLLEKMILTHDLKQSTLRCKRRCSHYFCREKEVPFLNPFFTLMDMYHQGVEPPTKKAANPLYSRNKTWGKYLEVWCNLEPPPSGECTLTSGLGILYCLWVKEMFIFFPQVPPPQDSNSSSLSKVSIPLTYQDRTQWIIHCFSFFHPGRDGFLGGHRQNNSIWGSKEHNKFCQASFKVNPSGWCLGGKDFNRN